MTGTVAFTSGEEVSKKFRLFLKVREIKGIQKILDEVQMLPFEERERWIDEYGEMINEAIDEFVDDSGITIENIFSDDEALALSQELIFTLKETISTVEGIMYEDAQLES